MNGVHDMGGMTCFGPIVCEDNEPVSHASWEKRVFALGLGGGVWSCFDEGRHGLERMDSAVMALPRRPQNGCCRR